MQQSDQCQMILSNLRQPAFIAEEGIITAVNTAASQRFAKVGTAIAELIVTGKEEYETLRSGSLYLTICLEQTQYPCHVTAMQDKQLFVFEEDTARAELQSLALAAQQLNMPVSEISLLVERLSDIDGEEKAKISKNLYRLRRILGNMADTAQLTVSNPRLTNCEMCAVFQEILEKASALLSQSGTQLVYKLPNHSVYSTASAELLRRAVYNMISNAVKYAPAGKPIEAALRHTGKRLAFSITSSCEAGFAEGNLFNRYTRQPGLEDPRLGLGLGMTLIHAAATAHGGTVLVEKLPGSKLRITMSLPILENKTDNVRSPILIPDIYSGSDQALIELSDVLPYQLYNEF